jgi:hypothetical protein
MQARGGRVKTLKRALIWFGVCFLNLRLKLGVAFVDWIFAICPKLVHA